MATIAAVVILGVSMLLSGCTVDKGPETPVDPPIVDPPIVTPDVDPDQPISQKGAKSFESNQVAEFIAATKQNNFSYKEKLASGEVTLYKHTGKICEKIENAGTANATTSYVEYKDGKYFEIQKQEDGQWHKTEGNNDFGKFNLWDASNWSDNKDGTYECTIELIKYTMTILGTEVRLDSIFGGRNYYSDMGTTKVTVPENIIDDTIVEIDPNAPISKDGAKSFEKMTLREFLQL